jgi:hypothetical protein
MVEPYFDAAGLSGCPASRGDVDHAALFQRVLYLCIHNVASHRTRAQRSGGAVTPRWR